MQTMSLKDEIKSNWKTDIVGFAQSIASLNSDGFPGWTVKYLDCYGVAIPYSGEETINESFSNAKIRSDILNVNKGVQQKAIILTADFSVAKEPFSFLCEALVSPGLNGANRLSIAGSPVEWWQEWKELLGNRDIDEIIYDTLGELCALEYYVKNGEEADWGGPDSATYDIELKEGYVEVKSTTSRSKKEITISSQFQLDPPGKNLDLIFCQFEKSVNNGISIDSVVNDLVNLGISKDYLNSRLSKKGLDDGKSARRRQFILHDMLRYHINEDFPRISPASFIGGVLPLGITKITYTVSLDGLNSESLLQGDTL